MLKKSLLILLGCFCLAAVGCQISENQSDVVPETPRHVIVISVDTLRTDYLGCYGNPDVYTPNLDYLARSGVQFRSCISPMGRTNPAFASFHTGLYPCDHGVKSLFRKLPDDIVTLAEVFQDNDFKTAFFNSNAMLRPKSGLTQGFDAYYEPDKSEALSEKQIADKTLNTPQNTPTNTSTNTSKKIPRKTPAKTPAKAPRKTPKNKQFLTHVFHAGFDVESQNPNYEFAAEYVSDSAVRYIDKLTEEDRAFMWVHYMDPHWPYEPPAPWNSTHLSMAHGDVPDYTKIPMPQIKFHNSMDSQTRDYYRGLYMGEVEYTDQQIGRFLRVLHQRNLLNDSMIVFVADHGESLGKNDVFFCHGDVAYQDNLSVPFMMRADTQFSSGLIKSQMHLTDAMPVILDFLKIKDPHDRSAPMVDFIRNSQLKAPLSSQEFMYAWTGETSDQNPRSYIQGIKGRWRTVMNNRYKLIYIPNPDETVWELYDMSADPAEEINLAGTGLEIEGVLQERLLTWIQKDSDAGVDKPDSKPDDPLELEQLRVLGYID